MYEYPYDQGANLPPCKISSETAKCGFQRMRKKTDPDKPNAKICFECTLKTLRDALDSGQFTRVGLTIAGLYKFKAFLKEG